MKAILQADTSEWQKVLDVNLSAVIHGTSLAARCMAPGGIILALASAGGAPAPLTRRYSAAPPSGAGRRAATMARPTRLS